MVMGCWKTTHRPPTEHWLSMVRGRDACRRRTRRKAEGRRSPLVFGQNGRARTEVPLGSVGVLSYPVVRVGDQRTSRRMGERLVEVSVGCWSSEGRRNQLRPTSGQAYNLLFSICAAFE
jgi:hypothetical protein